MISESYYSETKLINEKRTHDHFFKLLLIGNVSFNFYSIQGQDLCDRILIYTVFSKSWCGSIKSILREFLMKTPPPPQTSSAERLSSNDVQNVAVQYTKFRELCQSFDIWTGYHKILTDLQK